MDGIKKKLIIKYRGMLARCYNPKERCYHNYGGRGITICDEWLNGKDGKSGFECFYEWSINNGYQENLSIDRINNDLGYSPSNCQYTDLKTQANNTRQNINITYQGKTQTLIQWCEELDLKYSAIRSRITDYGWTPEEAFTRPLKEDPTLYPYKGKEYTLPQLAKMCGIQPKSLKRRIEEHGMTIEEAVETPSNIDYFEINGIFKPFKTWCKETGVNYATAKSRYELGYPFEISILNVDKTGMRNKFKEYLKEHPDYDKEKEKELRSRK